MTQEQLRMQMLAGVITEGEYKAKLNEIKVNKPGFERDYIEYDEEYDDYIIDTVKFLNYFYNLLSQAGYEIPEDVEDVIRELAYDGDWLAVYDDYPLSYWENYNLKNAKEDLNEILETEEDELEYDSIEDFKVR